METVRGLLTQGNQKVGESIHLWGLPAVLTCPGSTETCRGVCYATKGRFLFDAVKERLNWNLEQARRGDFVSRMVAEVRRKGCLVVRVHASGDFYDADYAEKWLAVMRRCKATFYWYSRSWVCPDIASVFERMAKLGNVRGWYSLDRSSQQPDHVPEGVRLAYLQTEDEEPLPKVDLVFRTRRLRKERIPLSLACPSESPQGRKAGVTCGSCSRCFR